MIIIDVNQERVTVNSDREAQKILQGVADKIRKHPWHEARQKVEALERKFGYLIEVRARRYGQQLKKTQFEAQLKEAKEAWALIDQPEKIVVQITKIK